jgi:uncharacterized glyoxalase superfamily protein PhnB
MSTVNKYIRHGYSAARPYLYGSLALIDFVKQVFDAEEVERVSGNKSAHIEAKIDDSLIALDLDDHASPDPASQGLKNTSIYVYVSDVDAVYQRALSAGATPLHEPMDKPYQERNAGFKDICGNIWWISTYRESNELF